MKLPTLPFLKTKSKTPQQVVSEFWEDRDTISQTDVNLFCWTRPFDEEITHYLERLLTQELKPIGELVELDKLESQIERLKTFWDSEPSAVADRFWQDILRLTGDFLSFTKYGLGTMHLRMVNDDACTKFHTDGYSLRLFSTYYGKGTEWLPESATNRSALGKSNEQIVKDQSQIRKMKPFEVGILKGESPESTSTVKGIVHRSPQVSALGEKRIILRVDI